MHQCPASCSSIQHPWPKDFSLKMTASYALMISFLPCPCPTFCDKRQKAAPSMSPAPSLDVVLDEGSSARCQGPRS